MSLILLKLWLILKADIQRKARLPGMISSRSKPKMCRIGLKSPGYFSLVKKIVLLNLKTRSEMDINERGPWIFRAFDLKFRFSSIRRSFGGSNLT